MGRLFWEPAHFVMEPKMLRTIRDSSERGSGLLAGRLTARCLLPSADFT